MPIRATYRLQLTAQFTFADAAKLAPYIARLGASHVYLSPILAARPGSTHGYDAIDHGRISDELGGRAQFEAMARAFRAEGLGIVLDIVPNHMGIGGSGNARWLDLLEWGPHGEAANWFDVDWASPEPRLAGRIMVPFLGTGVAAALTGGVLSLRCDADSGSLAVWIGNDHKLPLTPPSYGIALSNAKGLDDLAARFAALAPDDVAGGQALMAELATRLADRDTHAATNQAIAAITADTSPTGAFARLLDLQHWQLARHSSATGALNYRRFFTVNDLGGIRIDRPEVFDAVHALVFELVAKGEVDALRIDHIDGLADPTGYLQTLRQQCPRPVPIYVEKILAPGEQLPTSWPIAGTTGYEFAATAISLLTDPQGEAPLTRAYIDFTGETTPFTALEAAGKVEILTDEMAAERDRLARLMHAVALSRPGTADLTLAGITQSLMALLSGMSVYRAYANAQGASLADRAAIAAARDRAMARQPWLDPEALDFVAAQVLGGGDAVEPGLEIIQRFGQLSGPAMAKGLEDTALYRHARLIALNDVGARPDIFHTSVAAFHAFNVHHAACHPNTLLATSTHDSKRGEDARTRIVALSGMVDEWRQTSWQLRQLLAEAGAPQLDDRTLYYLLQSLLGAWPADGESPGDLCGRLVEAMRKAVREAREKSFWTAPDGAYERRLEALVQHMLDARPDNHFLKAFKEFEARVRLLGVANSLLLTTLKLTVPGVPDIYRGAESRDQSLVDPDNRRPVDFAGLEQQFDSASCPAKLALTRDLLALRKAHPEPFADGGYLPIAAGAPFADRVVAFARQQGDVALLVVAALWPWRGDAEDVRIALPQSMTGRQWQGVGDDAQAGTIDPGAPLALAARRPFLVLISR
jgi:(1->4)-alpha-D-glucan 1-alpha-D-glucosylmutase